MKTIRWGDQIVIRWERTKKDGSLAFVTSGVDSAVKGVNRIVRELN